MGCGSVQTQPPLFASLDVPVTLTEFRMRTNDFTEFFVAVIEDAADVIIEQAEDEDVRRRVMVARLRVVTAFLDAVSQPDPVASLVDVWAFCLQLQDFVTDGAGRPGFPFCRPLMAPLYTRDPPSPRDCFRRTIVQVLRPSLSPR